VSWIAAHARPCDTAVTGEQEATYGQLAGLAARAAGELSRICGPGDVVAIRAGTSLAGLVGILAAHRAGAAFLPLDAAAPAVRQEYILRDAGARAVIEGDREPVIRPLPDGAPTGRAVPAETAYLMYTSGSTGQPKGVLVPERALRDRLAGLAAVPGCAPGSTVLAQTALSFDISLAELLLPLSVGATIVLAPPTARADPAAFGAVVQRYRPGIIQATPSFWRLVLAAGWAGAPESVLWCGGEVLTSKLARDLSPLCRELWNLYGPTEATIWCTAWRVDPAAPVSLGDALPGSGRHLVDENGAVITEAGRMGEITLTGAGLALGYLGDRPEQRRFTALPGLGPAYLTGDRARYRADRSLEFLGRTDAQVKLRGHRVELGEVEAALEAHPAVHQAVVFLREPDDPARSHLAAVVGAADEVTERELRRWLAERLPRIMIPKRIAVRASLPRTTAGKVDRVALSGLRRRAPQFVLKLKVYHED
jgi:D-alanine--poly(phosphoribitol) ligase subunit 1